MKTYLSNLRVAIVLLHLIFSGIFLQTQAQTITIDTTFSSSGEIFPFSPNDTISGLGLSGDIVLNSDTSLVRVIFIDDDYNEHLLYEAYPYIVSNWNFSITNVADETKYLNQIQPHSIYVYISDASIEINSLHCTSGPVDLADSLQVLHKQNVESQKISNINANISNNNMIWFAAETSVSSMCYARKKAMFGPNFNMLGLEYYSGGVYEPFPGGLVKDMESPLVPEFDWRNRHGANDPSKTGFYYDGDSKGTGWLTPVLNQEEHFDCLRLCYIYGPIATLEGLANVYFNSHVDFDLSEQHVLDCDEFGSILIDECDDGFASITEGFFESGVVDEGCYSIAPPAGDCPEEITNIEYTVSIPENGAHDVDGGIDGIKRSIIQNGPNRARYGNYGAPLNGHFMCLVGYGVLKPDMSFQYSNGATSDPIVAGGDYDGALYWIYKNSMGDDSGYNGFYYHFETQYTP